MRSLYEEPCDVPGSHVNVDVNCVVPLQCVSLERSPRAGDSGLDLQPRVVERQGQGGVDPLQGRVEHHGKTLVGQKGVRVKEAVDALKDGNAVCIRTGRPRLFQTCDWRAWKCLSFTTSL